MTLYTDAALPWRSDCTERTLNIHFPFYPTFYCYPSGYCPEFGTGVHRHERANCQASGFLRHSWLRSSTTNLVSTQAISKTTQLQVPEMDFPLIYWGGGGLPVSTSDVFVRPMTTTINSTSTPICFMNINKQISSNNLLIWTRPILDIRFSRLHHLDNVLKTL